MERLLIIVILVFSLVSCNKNIEILEPTHDDKILSQEAQFRKDMSSIIVEITNDDNVLHEVFFAVKQNVYGDENVLFTDLLENEQSLFKNAKVSFFKSRFNEALKSRASQLKSINVVNDESVDKALKEGKVQIYWPYHENWDGITKPAISYYDGINDEENIGYLPNGTEILVNETYAMENPVWIINALDFKGSFDELHEYFSNLQKLKSAYSSPINGVDYISCQIQQVQCTEQTDGFFNGGPDLYVVRVGFVDEWHADVSDWEMRMPPISRPEVNNGTWKIAYCTWDSYWEKTLNEQIIGCYDWDDNEWNAKINGNVKGSYKYNQNGVILEPYIEVPFSKNYESKEPAIYCNPWHFEWARYNLAYSKQHGLGFVQTKWLNGKE